MSVVSRLTIIEAPASSLRASISFGLSRTLCWSISVVALLVLVRCARGGIVTRLDLLATLVLVAGVVGVQSLLREFDATRSMTRAVTLALLWSAALALPQSRQALPLILWAVTIGSELWRWRRRLVVEPALSESTVVAEPPSDDELSVSQQLRRGITAEGTDVLQGTLHVTFAHEQRQESVHVAFCPPFRATPQLDFETGDGPDVQIKLGQLLPYGARFDLKLAAPGPASVTVEFTAWEQP